MQGLVQVADAPVGEGEFLVGDRLADTVGVAEAVGRTGGIFARRAEGAPYDNFDVSRLT